MEWIFDVSPEIGIFLVVAGFVSAFIDSIVGGGGLISLPAMLLTGLPPTAAIGTNKLAALSGVTTAAFTFWRRGHVHRYLVSRLFWLSMGAAMLGSYTVMHVPPLYLEPLIVAVLIGVTVFVLYKKDWGQVSTFRDVHREIWWIASAFTMLFGFYDGFIGPGTGAFFMMAFVALGFDFVQAAGNSRCLNLASNLGSFLFFLGAGQIYLGHGLLMALGMVAGGYVGARVAILRGSSFVRIIFVGVTCALILRLAYQYWGGAL